MKLVAIVGSESHSRTYASARLETPINGFWEQTPKDWIKVWEEIETGRHYNWWRIEADIPVGTKIRYVGKRRYADRDPLILIFRMKEGAEVIEQTPDLGLRTGLIVGRMEQLPTPPKKTIDTKGGF